MDYQNSAITIWGLVIFSFIWSTIRDSLSDNRPYLPADVIGKRLLFVLKWVLIISVAASLFFFIINLFSENSKTLAQKIENTFYFGVIISAIITWAMISFWPDS